MSRIESIYSFIDTSDLVVDVGCDQAKLGLMLAKREQKSIASDISENVISKARESIGNNPYIDLRVSNGLDNIKSGEADTLVLSGMGTYTILDILKSTNLKFKKIITISNNNHEILRNGMNELGYIVDKEQIIKENNIYYNLIVFIPGKREYSEKEIVLGLNHIDYELYNEYLNYLLEKYLIIKKSSKDKNNNIDKMIKILTEIC